MVVCGMVVCVQGCMPVGSSMVHGAVIRAISRLARIRPLGVCMGLQHRNGGMMTWRLPSPPRARTRAATLTPRGAWFQGSGDDPEGARVVTSNGTGRRV